MAEDGQQSSGGEAQAIAAPHLTGLIAGQSKSKDEVFLQFADVTDSENDKNTLMLVCKFCKCKVLRPGFGSMVKMEKFLPSMTEKYQIGSDPAGNTVEQFWVIADKFHFENIGFTKTVNGEEKYLICADCEVGPIGWTKLTQPESYIAVERVQYSRN